MKQGSAHRGVQAVYFSHGGGPLPILGDPGHQAMVDFMRALPARLARPDAIVVVSAHWEERAATILGAPHPPMFYDYYGFPKEAYSITYPAPGHPALAGQIAGLLEKNSIPARLDPQRGFDHGLFIPLKLMYPEADIPAIQLSLLRGLDQLVGAGYPVLVGVSRKSLIGSLLGDPGRDRVIGSVTLALYAARQGWPVDRDAGRYLLAGGVPRC